MGEGQPEVSQQHVGAPYRGGGGASHGTYARLHFAGSEQQPRGSAWMGGVARLAWHPYGGRTDPKRRLGLQV